MATLGSRDATEQHFFPLAATILKGAGGSSIRGRRRRRTNGPGAGRRAGAVVVPAVQMSAPSFLGPLCAGPVAWRHGHRVWREAGDTAPATLWMELRQEEIEDRAAVAAMEKMACTQTPRVTRCRILLG
jgi:hypothetical protein